MSAFVGIDLGTTFSAVAHINVDGKPQVIADDNGKLLLPSVVYIGRDEVLVGDEAKERQALGDASVAAFFKRNMGDPNFELEFNSRGYTATDLSALVLKRLKAIAEARLGQVTQAVITVPAYFMNQQREATIAAGKQAGFDVLAIINEPTAAALAFGMRPTEGKQTVMVYDLGGGTFDISVVEIQPTEQRVLGTDGDHNLGGKDWDDRIGVWLLEQINAQREIELTTEELHEIQIKCENAKRDLSQRPTTQITVQAQGFRGTYELAREKFEELTADLADRTRMLADKVLHEINLKPADLTAVLMVGGSTRMPHIRRIAEDLTGKPPLTTVNPDEAVALGAAIQAAMEVEARQPAGAPLFRLAGRKKTTDVMSHSLGMIAIADDGSRYVNSIILPKNKPIPCEETRSYQLRANPRGGGKLEVYMTQAESVNPLECAYLGKYVFSDIPPVPGGNALIDVTYGYDRNGVVSTKAVERNSRLALPLSIEPLPPDLPDRFALSPAEFASGQQLTVYLAFDVSGSMDGQPLEEAKRAAKAFVAQCNLASTSVGLISFSDGVHLDSPACQDQNKLEHAIKGLSIGRTGYGNATDPFDELFKRLEKVAGTRCAVVLADGVWAHQGTAVKRAKRCHAAEIQVIGVGFGAADREFLRQISWPENSVFTDLNSLVETFSTIAQELGSGAGHSGLTALKARR
jgi:molecular chaperone DnaK (HSP70)